MSMMKRKLAKYISDYIRTELDRASLEVDVLEKVYDFVEPECFEQALDAFESTQDKSIIIV